MNLWYNEGNVYVPTARQTLGDMSHKDKPVTTSSIPLLRKCTKCDQELPATLEYFYKQHNGKHGLSSICKECRRQHFREVRHENPEEHNRKCAEWRTSHLEISRARALVYSANYNKRHPERRKEAQTKYSNSHVEIRRERTRQWQVRNPDKVKAQHHRRRTRKTNANGNFTSEDIQTQYESQNGKCWWCGCELNGKFHVDHRIPLSRGGSNEARNICCACIPCNLSKTNKMPWEWCGRLL